MGSEMTVGAPFLFEGHGCTISDVGGKTGKQVVIVPDDPKAAGFDARTFALAEIRYHTALKVWLHPARAFPKTASADAWLAAPLTGEG